MEHIVFIENSTTGAGLKAVLVCRDKKMKITQLTANKDNYISKFNKYKDILKYMDNVELVNTSDMAETVKVVRNIDRKNRITALTTLNDYYVPIAAACTAELGLPSISLKSAMNARNKFFMRELLKKTCPELNPKYYLVDSLADAIASANDIGYPVILKPQDENDGTDVRLIKNQQELESNYNKIHSTELNYIGMKKAKGGILIEEYMDDQEYSVETIAQDAIQDVQIITIVKKYIGGKDRGYFIEMAHCLPVFDRVQEIKEAVNKAIKALKIDNAICHVELKATPHGIKIVELNPRLAGGAIGSHMIEAATGRNVLSLVIDIARGKQVEWVPKFNRGCAIFKYVSPCIGHIHSLPNIKNDNNVVDYIYTFDKNAFVIPPERNSDLLGHIIVTGEDAKQAFNYGKFLMNKYPIMINNIEGGINESISILEPY